MNLKYSICISTYNNLNYLKLLLRSILEKSHYDNYEIIIFAENCTDGTNEYIKSLSDTNIKIVPYIEINNDPCGIGGGMNFCAEKANSDILYFLHSDMVVPQNHDLELLSLLSEKTVVSAWRIEPNIWNKSGHEPGLINIEKNYFGYEFDKFEYENFITWSKEFSLNNNIQIRSAGGAGGFMIYKKDWDFIGGNDPIFKPACYEDIDLFLRMQLENYKFIMTTRVLIYHFGARGSHFVDDGNVNNLKKSTRQMIAEQSGYPKFISKWGEFFRYDENKFPILTSSMKEYFGLNRKLR